MLTEQVYTHVIDGNKNKKTARVIRKGGSTLYNRDDEVPRIMAIHFKIWFKLSSVAIRGIMHEFYEVQYLSPNKEVSIQPLDVQSTTVSLYIMCCGLYCYECGFTCFQQGLALKCPNKQMRSAESCLTDTISHQKMCVKTMCVLINTLTIIHLRNWN